MFYKFIFLVITALLMQHPCFCEITPIDAQKNAQMHNKLGVDYFNSKDYFAAIKEFKIAIGINPNTQATSVYYNNLGRVYMVLGKIQKQHHLTTEGGDFSSWAQTCFERAVMQDCMNLSYYKNLVESYALNGILTQKANYLIKNVSKNPYNYVIVGLIYQKQGKKSQAVTIFDIFCAQYPDLVITPDIRRYANTIKL